MAYSSARGRKPMERASKISHTNIIGDPAVQALLAQCSVPRPAQPGVLAGLLQDVPSCPDQPIRAIVAVDGSMRETSVRHEFPSASITFYAFGPLLFRLEALRELDKQPFIAPEDLARLKNIQRYTLALPTRNVSRTGMSLRDSFRKTLHEFFAGEVDGEEPLAKTLRWILFRGWEGTDSQNWVIPQCPNHNCSEREIVLSERSNDEEPCPRCGRPIYFIDAFRLHERVDEEQGASAVSSYTLTILEQIVLIHVIRQVWRMKSSLLREVLFIKDGPLACFGTTAPLSKPLREMASFLGNQPDPAGGSQQVSLLNLVGLEKSGAFVEHAIQVDDEIRPGSVLPLSNDYIYRHIIPGDPASSDPYGGNTYWGGKMIFKAEDNNVYVATVPTGDGFKPSPTYSDFLNLTPVLSALAELKCSMYDNALIPVALANRLVSLSDVPSSRILETFARENIQL